MKNKNINVDSLLRSAMSSTETPTPELLQRVKYKMYKEEPLLKKTIIKRSFSSVAAAVMALVILSTTALAAWYFLKPSDVATKFDDSALSAAFESESAVNINQSVTSGDYIFTLLAAVSGSDLTDHPIYSNGEILSGRTYAVLAIQKADGSPMPDTSDDEYGDVSFIASPLVKGLMPWQVNAWTMNGGHSEIVADGILYRIVECDNVTMFADRGVYLGVATGSFINNSTFIYNEATGEITANPDYDGSSVVFDLPLDKSLADPVKAQQYLDTMWDDNGGAPNTDAGEPSADDGASMDITLTADGSISKQVMTYDTLEEWIENQLNELQKMVERGEYSKANMELSRKDFAEKLKNIESGNTVTLYTYADGSYSLATTYPDSGFDADVDASGGIVITD